MDSNPDIAASECFAKNIATDDDSRNLTLAYGFINNKFSENGIYDTVPLFECN